MIQILCGDCRKLLPTLPQYDFVFADPPFNIDQQYVGYDDNISDFEEFTREWVELCWTHCDGVLALHGNDDLAEEYCIIARELGMQRVAWIIWYYGFGQYQRSNWIQTKAHCLIFSKSDFTWNPESVFVDSKRIEYGDTRIFNSKDQGRRVPGSVWGIEDDGPYWGRVQGNNAERRSDHPNQLPEIYLKRLISAYTYSVDNILDPFGGSGTTAVVADSLGRNCTTIDISSFNCESIKQRLQIGMVRK